MILGPIAYIDCVVFIVLLVPQLLLRVRWAELIVTGLKAVPHLGINSPIVLVEEDLANSNAGIFIPYAFVAERYCTPKQDRSLHVQRSRPFQDFVVRCVRYAFARMPARIGRVFFSKEVALPFMRFRMLRNGIVRPPVEWQEIRGTGKV